MTIIETQDYIKSLITEAIKPSHEKIYNKFLNVLFFLNEREFSTEDIETIETHLDSLELKAEAKKRHIHILKKYSSLTSFLKEKFNLITEGHYTSQSTSIGMSMGMSLGMCFGISIFKENGIVFGMLFGMIIGLLFGSSTGASKDKLAKEAGNVIPHTKQ